MKKVVLKKGKESIFHHKHHWIFSGAIHSFPSFDNGEILPVVSFDDELLGYAFFNRQTALCGRIVSFGSADPEEALSNHIQKAFQLRSRCIDFEQTTAYRLINGEGDSLPGLIVDRYEDYLVLQVGTLGMERIKSKCIEILLSLFPFKGIYEKSLIPTRKEEGLQPFEDILWGSIPDEILIKEEGCQFLVSIKHGQKTGFFLDQREMRQLVRRFSRGKRILNCFSYSGGFSVAALSGGAKGADSVDISEDAMELAQKNVKLNGFENQNNHFFCQDVFQFLREKVLDYDLVILDPPAFAKKKADVVKACRGYKDINREALKKMPSGSFLLTCSCSYHVDENLFQKVLFQAALEAKRNVKILSRHRLAMDHPINLFHPETDYLKSFFLFVE